MHEPPHLFFFNEYVFKKKEKIKEIQPIIFLVR